VVTHPYRTLWFPARPTLVTRPPTWALDGVLLAYAAAVFGGLLAAALMGGAA
jgi:hypothetical protein